MVLLINREKTDCKVEGANIDSLEERNTKFDLHLLPTTKVNSNLNINVKNKINKRKSR